MNNSQLMKKIHVFGTAPSFKAGTFMEVLEYCCESTESSSHG